MDISEAYLKMCSEKEPTYVNFNGVYLYGGCKTPPHECADKETMRTILASMAMIGVMNFFGSIDYNRETIAKLAVEQADALIEELKKK